MLYDFDDYDIQQLDKMVELMSAQPSIGIRGGDVPADDEFEATVEFKDVCFFRPSWCVRSERVPLRGCCFCCGRKGDSPRPPLRACRRPHR